MSDGINASELSEVHKEKEEIQEKPETQVEIKESAEVKEQLEAATNQPDELILGSDDYKGAEALEEVFTATVDAVPEAKTDLPSSEGDNKLEHNQFKDPIYINDKLDVDVSVSEVDFKVEDAYGEDEWKLNNETPPDQIEPDEIKANAGGDDRVMIDTVPLPESPAEAGSRESIGTWPTPESPEAIIDSNDGVAIIDSNDIIMDEEEDVQTMKANGQIMDEEEDVQTMKADGQIMEEEEEVQTKKADRQIMDEEEPVQTRAVDTGPSGEVDLSGSIQIVESRLPISDPAKNQRAADELQEQILAKKAPTDYFKMASKVVEKQYGDLPHEESDALAGVVLGKTASAIDAIAEDRLNTIGDDAQLANIDLQNMLQKQQQTIQMLSNISKVLHDTALAVIRKIG
jgi:hypothetical protein